MLKLFETDEIVSPCDIQTCEFLTTSFIKTLFETKSNFALPYSRIFELNTEPPFCLAINWAP